MGEIRKKDMLDRFEIFTKNVASADKFVKKIKENEMRRFGIHGSCVMCLFYLGRSEDGLTPMELRELCGEDKAAISRALATLREKKYADIVDEGKIYRAKYRITEDGRAVAESIREAVGRAVFGAGNDITEEELEVFRETFGKIVRNLKAICEKL